MTTGNSRQGGELIAAGGAGRRSAREPGNQGVLFGPERGGCSPVISRLEATAPAAGAGLTAAGAGSALFRLVRRGLPPSSRGRARGLRPKRLLCQVFDCSAQARSYQRKLAVVRFNLGCVEQCPSWVHLGARCSPANIRLGSNSAKGAEIWRRVELRRPGATGRRPNSQRAVSALRHGDQAQVVTCGTVREAFPPLLRRNWRGIIADGWRKLG